MPQKVRDAENARFAKVFEMLQANEGKDFVKRILDPQNSPVIDNGPGEKPSTHKMATAEADGVHYVFPTITRDDFGELQQLEGLEAFDAARAKGEAIGFKTAEEADWFERNWKVVWGHPPRED